ncbi:TetR/AcrR family transcriptional regulator [Zhihengliuella flava]|uniref:TetR/AcrR family transcriptional repressor of lmrAB and yxaGH operons n=1 Tax=Zhihengliuella flava TaxID=1285193 RepID=A0A931GFW6_9MICC|nr:TetR/AcrR family transcriptional regulator [Zhihengliuella flava]MBG6085127.1 TetR/AcrR family transcriptional repressor of lmrAB and yxaGH operons [Zhihengliuella flava]
MTAETRRLPLRERNRVRTRSDILDAAAEALSDGGYAATALEELSRRAGLARGTLYAHFPGGREEIVRAVYLRVAEEVEEAGRALREQESGAPDRIAALARALVERTATASGRFYGKTTADALPVLADVTGGTSAAFESLIREDLAATDLPTGADLDALTTAVSGALRASAARTATHPHTVPAQVDAIRCLVSGLASTPGHRPQGPA